MPDDPKDVIELAIVSYPKEDEPDWRSSPRSATLARMTPHDQQRFAALVSEFTVKKRRPQSEE